MKKKLRMSFENGITTSVGATIDWQEWFGGYISLRLEISLITKYISIEITNRPHEDPQDE